MCHQEHGRARVSQLPDCLPDLSPGSRIKALRQLVEDHQPRLAEQREHQEQTLTLAAAERCKRRPASLGETKPLQQAIAALLATPAEQLHRLRDAKPVRQRRVLQLAPDQRPQPLRVRNWVEPQHAQRSRVGAAQALDALDRRGLTDAVGADQTDDFTLANVEVESVHNPPAAVPLAQPANGHSVL
jgi:hypothetical protein